MDNTGKQLKQAVPNYYLPPGGIRGGLWVSTSLLNSLTTNLYDIDAALHLCESLALQVEILRFVVCGVYEWLDAGELLVCEVTLDVLKLDTSREVRLEQPLNISVLKATDQWRQARA